MSVDNNGPEPLRAVANLDYREIEILAAITDGWSIHAISASLSIAEQEAQKARLALMEKLCARTTADLVRIGISAGVSRIP